MLAISLAPCDCPVCDGDRLLGGVMPNCYAPLWFLSNGSALACVS